MKLSQVPLTAIQKILLYGPPKSGKTELVGKLAEKFNLIWVDFENGYKTLQKLPMEWQQRIELVHIPDRREWPVGIETAMKIVSGVEVKVCGEHGQVNCIKCMKEPDADITTINTGTLPADTILVLDSLSQIAVSAMNNITRKMPDDYKSDWEDYRKQGALMDKVLTNIQQGRFNCICIGHDVDTSKDEKTSKLSAQVGTANFSRNVGKFFDHVIYCEVKTKRHNFGSATTYSSLALTGSRLDVALEAMEEPSLIPFFDGSWKQHVEELQRKEVKATLDPMKAKLAALAKR